MNMNDYQQWARTTAIYPEDRAVPYLALGLVGESGEVAEKVKKHIRDGTPLGSELAKELGDVLWYLSNLSYVLGFSLDDIANMNKNKLETRKSQKKLSGSGDNR